MSRICCIVLAGLLSVSMLCACEPLELPDDITVVTSVAPSSETTPPQTTIPEETEPVIEELAIDGVPSFTDPSYISATHGVCYNLSKDILVYGKDIDDVVFPASITKVVTALVAIENVPEDFEFVIGPEINLISPDSSVAGLREGQRLDLRGIVTALMLPSGNDAAYTIAVNVARSLAGDGRSDEEMVSYFTTLMNEYIKSLGAGNSNFTNPDGYHAPKHYSTVRDLLKVSVAAANDPLLSEICAESSIEVIFLSGENATWQNPHGLMQSEQWDVKGIKTGYTDEAGFCFAGYAAIDGSDYITIVTGCDNGEARDSDTIKLFELGDEYHNAYVADAPA